MLDHPISPLILNRMGHAAGQTNDRAHGQAERRTPTCYALCERAQRFPCCVSRVDVPVRTTPSARLTAPGAGVDALPCFPVFRKELGRRSPTTSVRGTYVPRNDSIGRRPGGYKRRVPARSYIGQDDPRTHKSRQIVRWTGSSQGGFTIRAVKNRGPTYGREEPCHHLRTARSDAGYGNRVRKGVRKSSLAPQKSS